MTALSGPWLICRLMEVEVDTSLPSPGLTPHTSPEGTTLLYTSDWVTLVKPASASRVRAVSGSRPMTMGTVPISVPWLTLTSMVPPVLTVRSGSGDWS